MALPDLTGSDKFIDDLNPVWPDGATEYARDGDDWIRGIQNVLQNCFPGITGAVTRTHTSLNNGAVPIGTKMVFYQAAAPTGWTRTAGILETYGLRVVATASAGGGSGGTDDPVLNAKVPSHTHSVAAVVTGAESADHAHPGVTGTESADHQHPVSGPTDSQGSHAHGYSAGAAGGGIGGGFTVMQANTTWSTQVAGAHAHNINFWSGGRNTAHTHSFTTGGRNATHTHTLPAHATAANGDAANWAPRYLDMIVCERTS